MDALDRKILAVLQNNARASLQEVGQAVGLSASPCWSRIKRMEEAGVIEGYTVRLNPQALGLADLARAMSNLVSTARAGKTQPAEMSGGTFTITNIGVFGVDGGTPILNPGESCILCLGQIVRRPWVVGTGADERIEPRWVTQLGLSFDHRLVDGQQGSQFLADVASILRDPGLALL